MKILHKKLGLLLCVALCVVCIAAVGSSAAAADADDISNELDNLGYNVENESGVVTVTGSGTEVELEINNDVKVIWQATTEVNPTTSSAPDALITISGTGTFVVDDGAVIEATDDINAIEVNSSIGFTVSGGTVSAENGYAIDAQAFDEYEDVTVTGGTISSESGASIVSGGSVTISGKDTVVSTETGVAVAAYGKVNVSGGTVEATEAGGVAIVSAGNVTISSDAKISADNKVRDGNSLLSALAASNGYSINDNNGGVAILSTSDVTVFDKAQVIATTGCAIYAQYAVTINGGVVSATSGCAIEAAGEIIVNGGTVSTESGMGIHAVAWVAKKVEPSSFIANAVSYYDVIITDGVVSAITGDAIRVVDGKYVLVSGGLVKATDGYAIYNETKNKNYTEIDGGCVFAYGSSLSSVINGEYYSRSGNGVIIAWSSRSSYKYVEGTNSDLTSDPSKCAEWAIITKNKEYGIYYKNGSNKGYIDLTDLVTVVAEAVDSGDSTPTNSSALSEYLYSYGDYGSWNNPYEDVSSNDWFYDDVRYVSISGFFNGTSATTFSPYDNMTRGMFVTVLGRMAGINSANYSGATFSDVDSGKYYAPYIGWASAAGVVEGFEDGTFRPDATITREQMAAMIYRFAAYYGIDTAVTTSLSFSDSVSVADWAKEGATFCQGKGIITGKTDNQFDPKGIATRAETAAMLHRLASWLYN